MNNNILGPLCRGDGWTFINDSCYWLSSYDATYEEADGVCQRMVRMCVCGWGMRREDVCLGNKNHNQNQKIVGYYQ